MKWKGSSLEKHLLRIALDSVNFTSSVSLTGKNNLGPCEVNRTLEFYANSLNTVIFNGHEEVERQKNGLLVKELKIIGVYATVSLHQGEVKIMIQFKGVFFACDNGLSSMQALMVEVMKTLGVFFRVTRIDVCQDISLRPTEILPPSNSETIWSGLKYCFKHSYCEYQVSDKEKGMSPTGFCIKNSRFEIRLYDKKNELKGCKSENKRKLYKEYFLSIGPDSPVTRFELQVKQENCEPYQEVIFDRSMTEDLFCREVLKRFSKKHSLKERSNGSKDQDWNRHPINENWKTLFCIKDVEHLRLITARDFRYTDSNKRMSQILNSIADFCAHEDVKIDSFVSSLKRHEKEVIVDAKDRKDKFERTQENLERLRKKVLDEFFLDQGELPFIE